MTSTKHFFPARSLLTTTTTATAQRPQFTAPRANEILANDDDLDCITSWRTTAAPSPELNRLLHCLDDAIQITQVNNTARRTLAFHTAAPKLKTTTCKNIAKVQNTLRLPSPPPSPLNELQRTRFTPVPTSTTDFDEQEHLNDTEDDDITPPGDFRLHTPHPPISHVVASPSPLRPDPHRTSSIPISTTTTTATTTTTTLQEQQEQASERLARELMEAEEREFVQRLHDMQQQTLRQWRSNGHGTEEHATTTPALDETTRLGVVEAAEEEETGVVADDMTYDQLLELGARLGDVRKERWREKCREIIDRLVVVPFTHDVASRSDSMCIVCQFAFEPGESIKLMPNCSHSYHVPCIDAWLMDNSVCPTCKMPVHDDDIDI